MNCTSSESQEAIRSVLDQQQISILEEYAISYIRSGLSQASVKIFSYDLICRSNYKTVYKHMELTNFLSFQSVLSTHLLQVR